MYNTNYIKAEKFSRKYFRKIYKYFIPVLVLLMFPASGLAYKESVVNWPDYREPLIETIPLHQSYKNRIERAKIEINLPHEFISSREYITLVIEIDSDTNNSTTGTPGFEDMAPFLKINKGFFNNYKIPVDRRGEFQTKEVSIKSKDLNIGQNVFTVYWDWRVAGWFCTSKGCGLKIHKMYFKEASNTAQKGVNGDQAAETASASNSDQAVKYARQGWNHIKSEQWDSALESFQKALEADQNIGNNMSLDVYHGLANCYTHKGAHKYALNYYQKALEIDPMDNDRVHILHRIGYSYMNISQYEEALKNFRKCITENDNYKYAYANIGNTYRLTGKYDQAMEWVKKAIAIDSDFVYAYQVQAWVYREQRQHENYLESALKSLALDPENARALHTVGRAYQFTHNYDTTLEYFHKALAIKPDYKWAHANIGNTYRMMGLYDQALEWVSKALTIDANFPWALSVKGLVYLDQANFVKADEFFDRVVRLGTYKAYAFNQRAWSLLLQSRYKEALSDINRALEIRPEYKEALHTRGRIYMDQHEYDRALDDFKHANRLCVNPLPYALVDIGLIQANMGQIDNAKESLKAFDNTTKDWNHGLSAKEYKERLKQLRALVFSDQTKTKVVKAPPSPIEKRVKDSTETLPSKKISDKVDTVAYGQFGQYYALIIGNSNYEHQETVESAINDAQKISKILEENYGFNVTLNLDANNQTILSTLNSYRNRLTENDHLLIFYSGHSWLNTNDGKGYWFPIDADDTKLNTWIDIDFITTILKDMDAKHVLILADSCYSGTIKRESNLNTSNNDYFKRMAKKRARSVISSGSFEPVLELTHQEGFSVFANAIIQSFLENDGILSATELFRQIRQPMLEKSNQTPVYADIYNAGHGGGDFLFVKTK